jgi:PAS domain S-box-containing protein
VKPVLPNSRPAVLRVVLVYAFVATLWILFSDTLISQLTDEAATLVMLGTLKGLAFVLLTSLLLYALLQRLSGAPEPPAASIGGRRLVAALTALALLILVVGAAAMRLVAERHEVQAAEQLRATARVKVGQIEAWLAERRRDAELLRSAPFSRMLRHWQRDGDAASGETVGEQLTSMQRIGGYRTVAVVDAEGVVLRSAGEPYEFPGQRLRATIARALVSGEVELSAFDRAAAGERPQLDLVAPLPAVAGARDLLLVFRPHDEDFLLPLLQILPVASASAETLLVYRDGETLASLKPLRHPADDAIARPLPIDAIERLALQAAGDLPLSGRDARGVPVLGLAAPVAGTSWWLIAKVDRQEVERPVQDALFWITLSVAAALFALVFFGIMLRQQQHLRLADSARQAQAEALRVRQLVDRQREERGALENHYQTMVGQARDIILLLDDRGQVVEANDAAVAAYGWSSEELRAMHIGELGCADAVADLASLWQASGSREGVLFETRHRRRDGSSFPVEVSARAFEIEGRIFRQSFIRDISDRQQAAAALQRSHRALRSLSECNQALVRASDEASLLGDICRLLIEFGGYRLAWVAYPDGDLPPRLRPVAHAGVDDGERFLPELAGKVGECSECSACGECGECGEEMGATALRQRQPVVAQNLLAEATLSPWHAALRQRGYASAIALPLLADGASLGVLHLYAGVADAFDADETQLLVELAGDLSFGIRALRDRAARDHAEATLRATTRQLEHLLEASPTVLYALRLVDGVAQTAQVSANIERISGYTVAEALQDGWWEAGLHPDDRDALLPFRVDGENAWRVREYRFAHRAGHYLWVRDEYRLSYDSAGLPIEVVGAWTDISASREAAQALQESERRYRRMFAANPQPMWVFDLDTLAFLDVNDAAIRRYGYCREEFLAMTIKDIRPPEEIPRLFDTLAAVASDQGRAGINTPGIWRHRRRDGSEMLVEITSHELDFGGRRGRVVLAHEVTAVVEAERQLRAALAEAQHLRDALDHVSAYIYIKDLQSRYVYANRPTLELFGCSSAELFGCADSHFFAPAVVQRLHAVDARVFAGEQSAEEIEVDDAQGEVRVYWEVKTPLYAEPERQTVCGLMGISTDITARKQSEQRLQLWATAFEHAAFGLALIDATDATFIAVNPTFAAQRGYTREELAGQALTILDPPELQAMMSDQLRAVDAAGHGVFETSHRRRDGSRFPRPARRHVGARCGRTGPVARRLCPRPDGAPTGRRRTAQALAGGRTEPGKHHDHQRRRADRIRERSFRTLQRLRACRGARPQPAPAAVGADRARDLRRDVGGADCRRELERRVVQPSPGRGRVRRVRDHHADPPGRRAHHALCFGQGRHLREETDRGRTRSLPPSPRRPGTGADGAARRGARHRRSRQSGEERFSGQHEPRDPHADERHRRPHPSSPARRSDPGAGRAPAQDRRRCPPPAGDHQRHSRPVEDRGRPPGTRADRFSAHRDSGQRPLADRRAGAGQGADARRRDDGRSAVAARRPDAAAPGAAQFRR